MKWNREVTKKQIDRFLQHVEKTDTCWLWSGCRKFKIQSNPQININAKTFSYLAFKEKILGKKTIVQTCEISNCVNPEHLQLEKTVARKELMRRCSLKSRERRRKIIKDLKIGRVCKVCGEDNLCCLDFHHRDPALKKFEISHAYKFSKKSIKEEIEKCDVLCANHHRKLHYSLKNFL